MVCTVFWSNYLLFINIPCGIHLLVPDSSGIDIIVTDRVMPYFANVYIMVRDNYISPPPFFPSLVSLPLSLLSLSSQPNFKSRSLAVRYPIQLILPSLGLLGRAPTDNQIWRPSRIECIPMPQDWKFGGRSSIGKTIPRKPSWAGGIRACLRYLFYIDLSERGD